MRLQYSLAKRRKKKERKENHEGILSVAQSSQRKNMKLRGVSIQRNVWACGQIVKMMAQMIEQGKERKGVRKERKEKWIQ